MSDELFPACGQIRLYHPSGALATLPILCDPADPYPSMFKSVDAALKAGFTVHAPGLEAGEEQEEVGYVCRTTKAGRGGEVVDMLFLYSANEAMVYRFLNVYLNTPDDVLAFELASGMKASKLPEYPGQAAPKRGESPASDKFIVKVPKPFGVVLKDNPKYDQAAADAATTAAPYTQPKRKFVRWASQQTNPPIGANDEAELRKLLADACVAEGVLMAKGGHDGLPLAKLPQSEYERAKQWLQKKIEARQGAGGKVPVGTSDPRD